MSRSAAARRSIRWTPSGARALDAQKFKEALAKNKYKLVAIVHAETSTGVLQPLDDIAKLVRDSGALLLVDAVTSLGGAPVGSMSWASTPATAARKNAWAARQGCRR